MNLVHLNRIAAISAGYAAHAPKGQDPIYVYKHDIDIQKYRANLLDFTTHDYVAPIFKNFQSYILLTNH